jgi:hypothetical protein
MNVLGGNFVEFPTSLLQFSSSPKFWNSRIIVKYEHRWFKYNASVSCGEDDTQVLV